MTAYEDASPASDADWSRLATESFVSLGTFRKSGAVVATPVWIAQDGAALIVTTERSTGKVRRLRRDARVVLQPCSRMGKVDAGAPLIEAVAVVADTAEAERTATAALGRKYGFQFRAFLAVERLVRRLQRRPGDRVILRITRRGAGDEDAGARTD